MTSGEFRRLALEILGSRESSHMAHPDFRINGKIFATLGYPDDKHGMVKLTPNEQRKFLKKEPGVFNHCAGAWGRRGSTSIFLEATSVELAREVLRVASKCAQRKKKGT